MFIDYAKIFVKAGDGGNGCVSFIRKKHVPNGGPDGGNGGRGGHIIFRADANMRTLLDFRYHKHFRADNGQSGTSNNSSGKNGQDLVIGVPPGTVIKDAETGEILADMFGREEVILQHGGRGGKGNANFTTPTRQAPNFAQPGVKVKENNVVLELKTIADIGLVGYPNVGKSTILSVVTKARPKIANYHFTTLEPNLGVIEIDHKGYLMADIPGLIEGASQGAGLGLDFLRHVDRTRLLIHVIDISGSEGRDPVEDYYKINHELAEYSPELARRPQIVAANKMDLQAEENLARLRKELDGSDIRVFPVSAATHDGFDPLLRFASSILEELPPPEPISYQLKTYDEQIVDTYQITRASDGAFEITGSYIEQLLGKINFGDYESLQYFQRMLREKGIIEELRNRGAKEGSLIRMNEIEFEYID